MGSSYRGSVADVPYCASSFLMYRTIADEDVCFSLSHPVRRYVHEGGYDWINDSFELESSLRRRVSDAVATGKVALALSGGIDSAILARMMPKGSTAYTFRCVVEGASVVDESPQAARYAEECGLRHVVIDVSWNDMASIAPSLMAQKGAPIHSIEVQIAKASMMAREEGFTGFLFGESSDLNYGGQSGLFSGTWTFGEWVDRYSYVLPYKVLRNFRMDLEPYARWCKEDGYEDVLEYCRHEYFLESLGSYENATSWGGLRLHTPFANTRLAVPLDYERIRAGENKYLVREVFERLYPGWTMPDKLPMPRATELWMAGWDGPTRPEFWPHCTVGMTGDQKWLVWALEKYLDMIDEQ